MKRSIAPVYSGEGSKEFWRRVNALDHDEGCYTLGCALQNLEEQMLTLLENCEKMARAKRRKRR